MKSWNSFAFDLCWVCLFVMRVVGMLLPVLVTTLVFGWLVRSKTSASSSEI